MKCYMQGKPCVYFKANVENDSIFIISPFGFPYDTLYANKGAVQKVLTDTLHLSPQRSDQTMRLGSIMCQGICKEIIERQYVFVDLSLPNPNVYYELGLAWALRRKVIACYSNYTSNSFLDIFKRSWDEQPAFIAYDQVEYLLSALDINTKKGALQMEMTTPSNKTKNKTILILESETNPLPGCYRQILNELLTNDLSPNDFRDEIKKNLSDPESRSFSSDEWSKWGIETYRVTDTSSLEEMITKICGSHICIVDTASYTTQEPQANNPYMYLCLGLAHGFEREVIPITNTIYSEGTPFDVKGMWHIFFSHEDEFKNGFKQIVAKISVECHKEIMKQPYNKICDSFLLDKKKLSIIYCGRPIPESNTECGVRTNIDSWDSRALAEASSYLAQNYPTSTIRPASPKIKLPNPNDTQIEEVKENLKTVYSNCLIIGSPDVSDYAEVVLSKIYGIEPFMKMDKKSAKQDGKHFIFYKNNIAADIRSSFYIKSKTNSISFFGSTFKCRDGVTYGILTVASNPFSGNGKVMVLSGYNGLATYSLMQLIIDSEMEGFGPHIRDRCRLLLEYEILPHFDPNSSKPFTALVEFKYTTKEEIVHAGDNGFLEEIRVISHKNK